MAYGGSPWHVNLRLFLYKLKYQFPSLLHISPCESNVHSHGLWWRIRKLFRHRFWLLGGSPGPAGKFIQLRQPSWWRRWESLFCGKRSQSILGKTIPPSPGIISFTTVPITQWILFVFSHFLLYRATINSWQFDPSEFNYEVWTPILSKSLHMWRFFFHLTYRCCTLLAKSKLKSLKYYESISRLLYWITHVYVQFYEFKNSKCDRCVVVSLKIVYIYIYI